MQRYNFLLAVIAVACLVGCRHSSLAPDELQGMWRTNEPMYKKKFLKFDGDYIVVGVGEDTLPLAQHIDRVTATEIDGCITYEIYSSNAEKDHFQVILEYSPVNGGELRLSNPKRVVWRRVS